MKRDDQLAIHRDDQQAVERVWWGVSLLL